MNFESQVFLSPDHPNDFASVHSLENDAPPFLSTSVIVFKSGALRAGDLFNVVVEGRMPVCYLPGWL